MRSVFAAVVILLCCSSAVAVSIDTVSVGFANNAPDVPAVPPEEVGAVAYAYRIGKYEVTNRQYVEFLNAKDPVGSNALELYNSEMANNANGGILFDTAAANGAKYAIKGGRGTNPVNYVTWFDAIRFANWLHNGQANGDTESGAYTLLGGTPTPSNGKSIARNLDATWFLPSADEWFKAAYYQPAALGGDVDNYWRYPTRSNAAPFSVPPPGSDAPNPANAANYKRDDFIVNSYDNGFPVTGSTMLDEAQNYLVDVGSYGESTSFFGTLDQAGNVGEWNETIVAPETEFHFRGLRGGSWVGGVNQLSASFPGFPKQATLEGLGVGFRVATIPEPSTVILAALGLVGLAAYSWRRKRTATACTVLMCFARKGILVTLAMAATPVQAAVLVYFDEDGGGGPRGLYNFDTETGLSTLRTPVGGNEPLFAWDVRRSDGALFAIELNGRLWTIDPDTRAKSLVGDIGLPNEHAGIAFHPLTDRLLVLQHATTRLYEVDASSAAATLIGTVGHDVSRGLSFSPTGELFAYQSTGPDLYQIDSATAMATVIGGATPFFSIREDSTFTADGELFVTDFFGNIYRTDPNSGTGVRIGKTTGGSGLLGLFSEDALIPEPSTAILAAMGLAGLLTFGSRRKRR